MGVQRMTVFDVSMSVVYGGVALGCALMLIRQAQRVWRNARDGWMAAHAALTEGIIHEDLSGKDRAR
jgi:TRAP-type C4-dicarboxylate transport system permease small subunit